MLRNVYRLVIKCFSALQRAEIAEIEQTETPPASAGCVSVLFNEPKLLKFYIQEIEWEVDP